MIKVELTKNIFNQRGGGLFGLKPIQLVFAAVAVVVGGVTVLWLMQYGLSINLYTEVETKKKMKRSASALKKIFVRK